MLFGGLLNNLDGIGIGAVLYPEAGLVGVPPPPTTPEILVRGSRLTMSWTAPPLGARPSAYVIEGGSSPGGRNLATPLIPGTFGTVNAEQILAGVQHGGGVNFGNARTQEVSEGRALGLRTDHPGPARKLEPVRR